MKFVTGFFMAWGNFLTLPCPLKRWDSSLKNMMLAFLPSVGLVVGGLWAGLFALLKWLELPVELSSFIMILYLFGVCGFMHMDGFMDCSDAIMSRRPLEERQRILKDSNVGAFAVVMTAFLLMGWYASMNSVFEHLSWEQLLIMPVLSRSAGGLGVLGYKPIGHSQYAGDYNAPGKGKYKGAILVQIAAAVCAIAIFGDIDRIIYCGAAVLIAGAIVLTYGIRQLGGMSGDIAGYTICVSELAGIIALAVSL